MIIRPLNRQTDMDGLRDCLIELQDFEREIDPRMPPGKEIADDYIFEMLEAIGVREKVTLDTLRAMRRSSLAFKPTVLTTAMWNLASSPTSSCRDIIGAQATACD